MRRAIHWITIFVTTVSLACGTKNQEAAPAEKTAPLPDEQPVASTDPEYEVSRFSTAKEAFSYLLEKTSPLAVGIGEIHQNEDTAATRSALVRFTEELLPAAAKITSDLIVETWVSTGRCGEAEQKVAKEITEVTERPAETEDETIRLLKAAAALNIKPHVLEMSCDNYRRIYEADGGTDYLLLLELVGEQLGQKALAARETRAKSKSAAKPVTVVYGGALHNDVEPAEMWKRTIRTIRDGFK